LDTDGDGCYDLAEGGAGTSGDSLVNQASNFSKVGTNGLADHLEISADCHEIKYSLQPYYRDSSSNACPDSDMDGIGDLIDIDDDNDGILDKTEMDCSILVKTAVEESNTTNGVASGVHQGKGK
jgi:hypothetical protein